MGKATVYKPQEEQVVQEMKDNKTNKLAGNKKGGKFPFTYAIT